MPKLRRYIPGILPFILIMVMVVFLLGDTLFPFRGKMIYGGDIYDAYFYWKSYLSTSIKSGIIPFWNPYNFSGTPFIAHPNINIFYPINWLFIVLPINQSFAFYILVHMIVAGSTMYWLLRRYSDKWGATAGALIYALGGYFAARIYGGHPEYIDTASWFPLAFGLTREALLKPDVKKIIYSGFGMAILLLSGNETFFLFFSELVFLYLLYLLVCKKRNSFIGHFFGLSKILFFSVIIAFGLTAVEFLPRWQFIQASLRFLGVGYDVAASASFSPPLFRFFLQPLSSGLPGNYQGPWPNLTEYTYYMGVLPVILIVLFVIWFLTGKIIKKFPIKKVDKDFWFFLLAVIPFILISLGNSIEPNFQKILWQYIPLYKGLRIPVRHLYIVFLSGSICAGMIIGVIGNKFIKAIIILFVIADLFTFDKNFIQISNVPTATFDQNLISVLKSDKDLYRLLPDYPVVSRVRRDLDFGAATIYKIQTTSDYNSMILWNYYHFIDLLNRAEVPSVNNYNVEIPPPNPWSPLIDFLNIKYILSDKNYDAIGREKEDKFKVILSGERYVLYKNMTYKPRFFMVGEGVILPNNREVDNYFLTRDPQLERMVVFSRNDLPKIDGINLNCGEHNENKITVTSYQANYIALAVSTDCNGLLSSSEVYYPGWKAKIDGQETRIFQGNVAFRVLYITKGNHKIEFYYQPNIFYLGGVISIITILFVLSFLRKAR